MPRKAQPKPPCSIDCCDRQVYARTWCAAHHWRWKKYGDPQGQAPQVDVLDRIMRRVEKRENGCWIFTGCLLKGYGQIRSRQLGGTKLVHRVVYECLVGPIPEGLDLDHLCRTPACCNPGHLEPVTHAENMRRGVGLPNMIATRKDLTHCQRGHEFTPENTYVNPGTQARRCKECHRGWTRAYLKKREAAA